MVLALTSTSPFFINAMNCDDQSQWSCNDYFESFENKLEETLECLLNHENVPKERVLHFGFKTRKIKSLDTKTKVHGYSKQKYKKIHYLKLVGNDY